MAEYTTQSQIEDVLQRDLTTEETNIIEDIIESVSATINAYTGRNWVGIDEEAVEDIKLYDGNGQRELFIDDFISPIVLEFVDSLTNESVESDNYLLYPLNTTWKNSIRMRNSTFPRGYGNIQITAKFNSGDVPVEVQLASATLCGLVISSSRNIGDFKRENIEGYSYELLTGQEKTAQEKAVLDRLDFWRKINI